MKTKSMNEILSEVIASPNPQETLTKLRLQEMTKVIRPSSLAERITNDCVRYTLRYPSSSWSDDVLVQMVKDKLDEYRKSELEDVFSVFNVPKRIRQILINKVALMDSRIVRKEIIRLASVIDKDKRLWNHHRYSELWDWLVSKPYFKHIEGFDQIEMVYNISTDQKWRFLADEFLSLYIRLLTFSVKPSEEDKQHMYDSWCKENALALVHLVEPLEQRILKRCIQSTKASESDFRFFFDVLAGLKDFTYKPDERELNFNEQFARMTDDEVMQFILVYFKNRYSKKEVKNGN